MKIRMVFPQWFKWLGFLLFVATFLFPVTESQDLDDVHYPLGLLIQVISFVGLLFMAGAKVKGEDEWVQFVRLNSIQWALLLYMGLRIGMKCFAFFTKNQDWLPENVQINSLLIIYIILFYVRIKILPLLQSNKS